MSSPDDLEAFPWRSSFSDGAALIVGVGSGAGVSGERPPDMEWEARELARRLGAQGGYGPSRVHVLLEGQATRKALRRELSGLVETAQGPDDVVLFCFVGPAIKLAGGRGAGVYLLPFDADPSDVPDTALSLEEVASFFNRMEAGQVFALLDLYYPIEFIKNTVGLRSRRRPFDEEDLIPLAKGGSRVIVASPHAMRLYGHESLTALLHQALEGAARPSREDGLLRTGDLIHFFFDEAKRLNASPPYVAPAIAAPNFPISLRQSFPIFATPWRLTHIPRNDPRIDVQIDEDRPFGVPFNEPWIPRSVPVKPPKPLIEPATDRSTTPRSLPAATGTLYPKVSSTPNDFIEPDQEMVFAVELDRIAPMGASTALTIAFPEGAASTLLHASVSSTSFVPPPGESWSGAFIVGRDLSTSPARWAFRARAIGDQPFYSLTITFVSAGLVVGAVVVTVPRRNVEPSGVVASGEALELPKEPGAARLVMKISNEPPGYKIRLYLDGKQEGEAIPWIMSTDPYFSQLEAAASVEELHAVGNGLWADLPTEITEILERPDLQGAPMLIVSDTAIAPFEVLRLRPSEEDGPLLGLDRPVLRWINDAPMPLERERLVREVACIRPEYPPPDALPSAAVEEEELRARVPSLRRIARTNELDELLNEPGVRLIHFAGHADGNPAKLALENGNVLPSQLAPSKPLLREGHPFMFLNGCRIGRARDATPSSQANIIKFLLKFRCVGAIAPVIPIQSAAALEAARTFYAATIGHNKSIGDAMLEVRRLAAAKGTDPKHRASLMSYLVFAPPGLRLRFTTAPEDAPAAGSSPS